MATYNTAFGSLPGYNEQMGTTNTTGGGQQPTYDPQRRQRRQQQPGQSQTFAQMQQQGVARPAPPPPPPPPPMGIGGSGGAPPMPEWMRQQQQPPMLRQLQQQFQPMAGGGQQVTEQFQPQMMPQRTDRSYAMAQRAQQPPQPQPAPGAEPQGMLTAEQAGGTFLTKYAGGYSPAELQQMQPQQAIAMESPELFSQAQPSPVVPSASRFTGFMALPMASPTQPSGTTPMQMYQGLLGQLQEQLGQAFAQPSGFSTEQFRQIRGAQSANLQAEYEAQQKTLNEELARRGLSASSIGGGRMGDLAGQQARALASLDAQLLQQQAEMGQRGRETALGTLAQATGQLGQQVLGQQEVGLRASEIQQRGEQFGLQLNEQQAARLQQFGISTQELGLRAQQIQNEAALQGRQLSITEAQNQAQNQLEAQRITNQASQFGLQLNEQQAARLQQYGLSVQELGLRSQQLQQEAQLQGRQLSITEAQNLAQNQLEQQRIFNQANQFGLQLNEQQAARLQQGGFTAQELALEAQKVGNQAAQFGQQLSAQERQNVAINNLEAQRIANQASQFGLQLTEQQAARAQQAGFTAQELVIRTQQLQQEADLEGRRLSVQEAQNKAVNQLERDRLVQQGEQFGLQLGETQAARLQQYNISTQELALRTQQVQQDAAIQGRQLTLQEAQNAAQNQLERERLAQQGQQFGVTTAEQQRQFNIEQELRQRLGLGGLDIQRGQLEEQRAVRLQQLGISQQELGLRAQQLQQEAQLQGRQLSIQEAQNKAGNQLERDRLIQQGQQFGLQLDETKAARLQQYGLSTQELGLQAQRLQQDAALQGRQLSITEAQNLAQNQLEQQRITNQAAQFGLQLNEQQAQRLQQGGFTAQELALESQRVANQALQFGQQLSAQERQNQAINSLEARKLEEDANFRSQQLGLNRDELDARKEQIRGDLALRGIEIDDQRAYREAEIEARTQQIQNEFLRSGQQIDVDKARIQAQKDISDADNTAQMNRLEAQLSAQASESALERRLRGALGMAETTGFVFDPATGRIVQQDGQNVMTVQGRSALAQQRLAENQFLMQLVSSLGNVDLGKSIKDLIDRREPIDKNQTYDPRLGGGVDGKDGGDTGQTDQVKGRGRYLAYETNPDLMDNLASVLDTPGAFSRSATPTVSPTLQALASALGISPAALQSLQTGTPRTSAQSALSGALSGLQPNATSGSSSFLGAKVTPTLSSSTREALRLSSYKPETQRTMSAAEIQRTIQQRPDYQAMQSRLMSLPREQQNKYIKTEELFQYFPQGPFIPEEAMPGTVYFNYNPTKPAYLAYDGVGFQPLTPKVESIGDPNDPIRGIVYRLPDGTRWA